MLDCSPLKPQKLMHGLLDTNMAIVYYLDLRLLKCLKHVPIILSQTVVLNGADSPWYKANNHLKQIYSPEI